jgi:ABC-2 type transport system permease protein
MAELEYRFNIAARFLTDIVWYAAQLSVFEVLFRHTNSMNGWSIEETRVFMGVLFVTDAIYMLLFSENLDRMGEKIRRGDLDLLLVKPVNSQWMLSFQKVSIAYLGNAVFSLAWLIWSMLQITNQQTPNQSIASLLWLIATVPMSLSIVYTVRFVTAAAALFFTKADAVNYIWYQLYRLGTRPDSFYPAILRYIVLSAFPIAFLASVPAQIILGKTGPVILLWGYFLAALFIFGSTRFWKRGLRSYSSASS